MHARIYHHSTRLISRPKRGVLIDYWNVHFYGTHARKEPFDILFFGRDEFSCRVFKRLHDSQDVWKSISIATNPDVKTGRRGSQLSVSPLKLFGGSLGVPIHAIPRRKADFRSWLPPAPFAKSDFCVTDTHLLVTASFGRILSPSLLRLFPQGQRLNVHPSLLPAYRGPAPIQRALMQGEEKTGVCVIDMMEKREGIDAGSIWGCESMVVPENSTFASLSAELAYMGGDLLVKVLRNMLLGNAHSAPQYPLLSTMPHASAISASDALVQFTSQTATDIVRLSRAISHQRPLTIAMPDGRTLQLHDVNVSGGYDDLGPTEPGWAVYSPRARTLLVSCADGKWLSVQKLKTQDRALLAAKEWWNGVKGLGLLHEGRLKLG